MNSRPLSISGAWFVELTEHQDERGWFSEAFQRRRILEETGRDFPVGQINISKSYAGVIRGIHYSLGRPGQAKYVQCLQGEIIDFVVDLRQGSPTFGVHDFVKLSHSVPAAILIGEGLGHAFAVLEGPAQIMYATTSSYDPSVEFVVNPFDDSLRLPWPSELIPVLSERDARAPSLGDVLRRGELPLHES